QQRRREGLAQPQVFFAAARPEQRGAVGHRPDLAVDRPFETLLKLLFLRVEQVTLEDREDLTALLDVVEQSTTFVLGDSHLIGELPESPPRVAQALVHCGLVERGPPELVRGPELRERLQRRACFRKQSILLASAGEIR